MGRLYFHSPCFDGIVSAVLLLDYLETAQGWRDTALEAVHYPLEDRWPSRALDQPSAVGVDHHPTAFATPELRDHFEARRGLLRVYDPTAGSCAGLLQRHLRDEGEVQRRYAAVREHTQAGLDRLRAAARLDADGIAVFDVDASDVTVSRYAPYLLFPQARYAAGIMRGKDAAKVTAMRNPWLEFESVPLGPICARLGGGGHQRVGSVALQGAAAGRAPEILRQLLDELRRQEKSRPRGDVRGLAATFT